MACRTTAVLAALVLAMPSMATAQATPGGLKSELAAVDQAWQSAYNMKDASTLASLYTEDATVMAEGHAMASGRSAILSLFTELLKDAGQNSVVAGEVIDGGAFAVATGNWSATDAKGKHQDHGTFMTVYKKVGGMWMIYRDIWNSSM